MTVAAPLIVLICGMGWNYAFVGAVIAVQAFSFLPPVRAPGRWAALGPNTILVLSMVVYLLGGSVTDASTSNGLNTESRVPVLILYAVGSSLGNPEALLAGRFPLEMIAILGGAIALVGVVAGMLWVRRGAPGSRLPLLLALYGVLVAASLALARGADGPSGVMASRYYMDLTFGLMGVIWLAAREVPAFVRHAVAGRMVVVAMIVTVVCGHVITYRHEWKVSPYRAALFDQMNRALQLGVPNEESAQLLQSPMDHARKGLAVMRSRRLAMFSGDERAECSTAAIGYGQGWHSPEGEVRWSGAVAEMDLPPCGCAYFADMYVPEGQPERQVLIKGSDGEQALAIGPGQSARARLGNDRVELDVTPVLVPSRDLTGSQDGRKLGVLLAGVSVNCEAPGVE